MEPIKDYRATIRRWGKRFKRNPDCDYGSDLYSDSLRYPVIDGGGNFNAGKMTARALSTGISALCTILDIEKRQERHGVNVPGLSVLSRTGMVSASIVIWLLESDDADVRFERGLRLSRENVKQFKALADRGEIYNKTIDPQINEIVRCLRGSADAEIAALEKMMDENGFKVGKQIENSRILFDVSERLNGYDGDSSDYRKSILDAWRMDSGFAHALAWPYEIAFTKPPREFYEDVVAAPTLLMADAIDLLDRRRTA